MGAAYCQWGGLTDWNICNIHGEEHLASRCRAMLRTGTFSNLAHCQPHWQLANTGNPSRGGPLSVYNFWQVAKFSWHAANSTPPDPPWFWIVPRIARVTKIGQEKAYFHGYLTLTFDLWPQFAKKSRVKIKIHPHTENQAPRSIGYCRRACDTRKES